MATRVSANNLRLELKRWLSLLSKVWVLINWLLLFIHDERPDWALTDTLADANKDTLPQKLSCLVWLPNRWQNDKLWWHLRFPHPPTSIFVNIVQIFAMLLKLNLGPKSILPRKGFRRTRKLLVQNIKQSNSLPGNRGSTSLKIHGVHLNFFWTLSVLYKANFGVFKNIYEGPKVLNIEMNKW